MSQRAAGTRQGLDTNVLVYAHLPLFPESERVRSFLLTGLADPRRTFALTPLVLHELVHVITDRRRFEPPVSMPEALAIARGYLGRSNVECLAIDEQAVLRAFLALEQKMLGRRKVADVLLAATLLTHGVTTLVTCNPDDFAAFEELDLVDPRVSEQAKR